MPDNFNCQVLKVRDGHVARRADQLAVEEPLAIKVDHTVDGVRCSTGLTVTMRTPGHDRELAIGFLANEGVIHDPQDIIDVQTCGDADPETGWFNTIKVELAPHVQLDLQRMERHFATHSSCGVCGKTSIAQLQTQCRSRPAAAGTQLAEGVLRQLPALMRSAQASFGQTGGLHASAMFSHAGTLLAVFEDVGRHNALDKLSGHCWLEGLAHLDDNLLLVSGRLSFELVQKAVMTGFGLVAAIGPPSSLALQLARQFDVTLVGFLNAQQFNIYHGPERISGLHEPGPSSTS